MDSKRLIFCSSTVEATASDQILWDEIALLHPYIKSFYVMTTHCPKAEWKQYHHHLVVQFSQDKHIDLSTLPEEFTTRWGLTSYQRTLDRATDEWWSAASGGPASDGGIIHRGIPPIRLDIPMDIVERMVPNPESYHICTDCFNYTPPVTPPSKKSRFSLCRNTSIVAPS